VGEEPEKEREAEAKNETGDDGKIKRGVFVTMDDVAGKTAKAQREFSAEVEKNAKENEETAEEEERAAEFAQRAHGKDSRRSEAKKERSQRRAVALARLNKFQARKEIADFEGGSFGGVGAVGAIVADAGTEVAADGAGGGLLGIGGAHSIAPFLDGALGFEDHGEDFSRAHEVGEFAEERTLAMDGVKAAGFFFGEAHGFDSDNFETGFVDAREDFALKIAPDGVGLDDCQGAFDWHKKSP
jgi:hypothetical protein